MSNIDKRALNQAELESALLELKRISEQPAVSTHYARVLRQHIANMGHRIAELDQRLIEYAGIATREALRVAELEARTVSIPEVRITVAESKRKNLTWRELGAYNEGADVAKEKISKVLAAAGVKVKGE